MKMFPESLFKIGQPIPPSIHVDTDYLLPSGTTVRSSISELARASREKLKSKLINILKGGASLTSDGVKGYVDVKLYYSLVIQH